MRAWPWLAALFLAASLAACGGGGGSREPVLGFDSTPRPPTVTAVSPVAGATGVALNVVVSADFSEPMAPITGGASFVVSCAAPCVSPTGTVGLDATRRIATFTLAPGSALAPLTEYTATIAGASSSRTGLSMVAPYSWRFTTQMSADSTRPRVTSTVPATSSPGPTLGVPANTSVSATFSEDMAPSTISPSSFTVTCALPCVSPAGTVTYVVGNRMAVFTPGAALTPGATYTAVITAAAADLAGNALAGNQAALPAASNYVWTFTATAASASSDLAVASTNPAANSSAFTCTGNAISATFSVPSGSRIDPTTIGASNFIVTEAGGANVPAASVVLDASGRIATFTPQAPLSQGATYRARIRGGPGGVRDLAVPGNTLAADYSWNFVVGTCTTGSGAPTPGNAPPTISLLGTASTFGVFGGTGGTVNQGTLTVISGDVGTTAASTTVTGLHHAGAGCTYTETGANMGTVNGRIYTAPPPPTAGCPTDGTPATLAAATQARADTLAAYNNLAARPAGTDPGAGNLANLTLTPGTYTAAGGSFRIQGGDLTLDAQGNANATWVFQMATTLTVGTAVPQNVILINGAQSKNVYWQVGTTATVNAVGGGTMVGTIITQAGAALSGAGAAAVTTLNGRVLSTGAAVTLVDTVINVPAP
ncbi:Ig-like domain-containing protein [Caenimonas sedimenti]|nr:Ig-like domain-containing protein [Caenimonas sedimenti]